MKTSAGALTTGVYKRNENFLSENVNKWFEERQISTERMNLNFIVIFTFSSFYALHFLKYLHAAMIFIMHID